MEDQCCTRDLLVAQFNLAPALRDPPAFTQAPFEEHLPVSTVGLKVICFDLEMTGLRPDDEIVQIGAKSWKSSFEQYVVPPTKTMHPEAAEKTGLLVEVQGDGGRRLLDKSTGSKLPTVGEREALLNFIAYLKEEVRDSPGLVLASHGAIFLDIPVLLTALQRNYLTDDFFQIVLGMCDTAAIVQERYGQRFPKKSLTSVYSTLTGENRTDEHRAPVDARDLYTVLQILFEKPDAELLFINDDLWFTTWTPNCLMKYVAWANFWHGERRESLCDTFAPFNNRLNKTIVHNLVLAGCTTGWLREEFRRLGNHTFGRLFNLYLESVKSLHENYLTDTSSVTAIRVSDVVCQKLRTY